MNIKRIVISIAIVVGTLSAIAFASASTWTNVQTDGSGNLYAPANLNASGTITENGVPVATSTSGGGLTGNSTSTWVPVYTASGTLAGYTSLSFTSSTNTLALNGVMAFSYTNASGTFTYSIKNDGNYLEIDDTTGTIPGTSPVPYDIILQNCPPVSVTSTAVTSSSWECALSQAENFPDGSRSFVDWDTEYYPTGTNPNIASGWFDNRRGTSSVEFPFELSWNDGSINHVGFSETPATNTSASNFNTLDNNGTGYFSVGTASSTTGAFDVYQNGASTCAGIYDSGAATIYGLTDSLPAPAGCTALGGYYHGLGIGGSSSGTGNPIFGVLAAGQSSNGRGHTALTVYDTKEVDTFNNQLDDGSGNAVVSSTLKVGGSLNVSSSAILQATTTENGNMVINNYDSLLVNPDVSLGEGVGTDTAVFGARANLGIAVPFATAYQASTPAAFDVFPKGPTIANGFGSTIYGAAWEDICSSDLDNFSTSTYECLHLGKSVNTGAGTGYANISTEAGGSGIVQPLELQANGGNVGIGTSTPNYLLTVNGSSSLQGNVGIGVTPTTTYNLDLGNAGTVHAQNFEAIVPTGSSPSFQLKGTNPSFSMINVNDSATAAGVMQVTYNSTQFAYNSQSNDLYVGQAFLGGNTIVGTTGRTGVAVTSLSNLYTIEDDGNGHQGAATTTVSVTNGTIVGSDDEGLINITTSTTTSTLTFAFAWVIANPVCQASIASGTPNYFSMKTTTSTAVITANTTLATNTIVSYICKGNPI